MSSATVKPGIPMFLQCVHWFCDGTVCSVALLGYRVASLLLLFFLPSPSCPVSILIVRARSDLYSTQEPENLT